MASSINYAPGNILYSGTDYINLWQGQAQQAIAATNTTNIGWGQLGQAFGGLLGCQAPLEQAKEKVMSLVETLRKEVGDWHGSLGAL